MATTTKFTVIIQRAGGTRVHRSTCPSVARDKGRSAHAAFEVEAASKTDAVSAIWSDILAEVGEGMCRTFTEFMPCCGLPN